MRSQALSTIVLTLLLALPFSGSLAQEEIDLLRESGLEKNQRSAVIFLHDEHNDAAGIDECNECHHVYEDGLKLEDESSEDQKCADCHNVKTTDSIPGLRKAFHLNCKGCHLQSKKGPVMCGQCHER